jgi:hypothetical protein
VNSIPIAEFEKAIRATHGAGSRLIERVHVIEDFQGERVWEGEVLVFELEGHHSSSRVYAWEVNGEVTAVLHQGPVDGPQAAVRASIVAGEEHPRMTLLRVGHRPTKPGRYYYARSDDGPRLIAKVYPGPDGRLWQKVEGEDYEEPLEDADGAWSEEPIPPG